MNHLPRLLLAALCAVVCGACALPPPGTGGPVTVGGAAPSVVTSWSEVAAATINLPPDPAGTAAEQRPVYATDLATVHMAVYDAVMAIAGTHRAFAVTPAAPSAGASQEAAAGEAAYRVLLGLYPGRRAAYQPAYEAFVTSLAEGAAKQRGLAVGAEVAAGVLALRAGDGRSVALSPYAPGNMPGQYRGANPIGRMLPSIKPFALTSLSQFRAPGPPALGSARYAADVEETRRLGSAASTARTPEQTETARFHTEPPFTFWPRNLRRSVASGSSLGDQARLLAMVWVTHADASNACFESKYHFQFWRPFSAIALADADGNDATTADPAWKPVVPTPPHPEYPAAHSCAAGALAETLRRFYGTSELVFEMNSSVTGSTHHYTSVEALLAEIQAARIAGGMHFRSSTVDGAALGKNVAAWALSHHFQPR